MLERQRMLSLINLGSIPFEYLNLKLWEFFWSQPYLSGFVAELGGGFRQINISQMKPMIERKVAVTFLVAQAQKKYS